MSTAAPYMRKLLGYFFLIISCLAFALLLVVPFLPMETAEKAAWGGGIFIFAEVTWYLALPLLGKEIIEWTRKCWDLVKAQLLDEEKNTESTAQRSGDHGR